MPTSAQHFDSRQPSLDLAHSLATQLDTFGGGEGLGEPGVRGPRALQLQGFESTSERSGPGEHSALQPAIWPSFSKHCMPASLQHFALLQFPPCAAQTSGTQLASFTEPSAGAAGLGGVRTPMVSQLHLRWFQGSLGSTPGVQFDLHEAQNSSRT
mmetsp:Transcript_111298/g.278660  ORF Transcript_111298/g.278660 Transcript_111298/m.278660 type:complete len:155 (-) Transcript_111298:736-1200(-)